MPRGLVAGVIALALVGAPAGGEAAEVEPDKRLHFGVSVGLGAGAYAGASLVVDDRLRRLVVAVPVALLPGVAKELFDASQPGNRFSTADLAWDLLGAITGAVVAALIDRLIFGRPVAQLEQSSESVRCSGIELLSVPQR